MRIVTPTHPPSMAVVVDTILQGKQTFPLAPADLRFNRIDVVSVVNERIRIFTGVQAYFPLEPKLEGRRVLATIYIPRGTKHIIHSHITEKL